MVVVGRYELADGHQVAGLTLHQVNELSTELDQLGVPHRGLTPLRPLVYDTHTQQEVLMTSIIIVVRVQLCLGVLVSVSAAQYPPTKNVRKAVFSSTYDTILIASRVSSSVFEKVLTR